MKRTFLKIVSKKFLTAAAIIALFSVATATNAKAGEVKKSDLNLSAVEYTGTVNNNVSFNIKYDNEAGSDFSLIVKNENGEVIYSHVYNDKNFSKKVVIRELPEDGGNVTFIIKSNDADIKQSFNINTVTTAVSNVVVTKAK
jgi:hypothetical protein